MKTLLNVNLTTRTVNDGGSAWVPPALTFGEDLTLALHLQRNVDGAAVDYYPEVNSMKAAIGNIDARPTGGTWHLKLGSAAQSTANTTAAMQFNVNASGLQAAINALAAMVTAYGTVVCWESGGSLFLLFGTGAVEVPLTVVSNRLWPLAFGKINAVQRDGQWIHEIRLVQSPVAFTDAGATAVPAGPSLSYVQHGGAYGGVVYDTIMSLYLPPDFKGAYKFEKDYVPSSLLSLSDGVDQIAAALAVFGTGITVTNPLANVANIDWGGAFAGADVALPTIVVVEAPPGDLNFTISLAQAELVAMLRLVPSVTLPLEVRLVVTDTTEDNLPHEMVAFTVPVTINRPVTFPELALTPNIDWLQPPSPKDYMPFNPSQVITGQQFFQAVIGTGSQTAFAIAHGLATEVVFVFARINANGGRQLVNGTDFTVTIDSNNQVTVTALTGAPAVNAWAVYVMSAQTVAAFADGLTVEIGQVNGLTAVLETINSRLTTLESLLPSKASLANTVANQGQFTIPILPSSSILFLPSGSDPANLPARAPFMLPAVHTATVTNTSIAPTPTAASVWLNNNSSLAILVPGGGMVRSSSAAAGTYIASDGRIAYPARRSGSTISYYPVPFEQQLWNMFINDKMFPVGTLCTVWFGLALQLVNATSEAQYVLVIEKGVAARDVGDSPDTTDTNLQAITWDTVNLILCQQIILTPALITHAFGCQIANNLTGLTANGYYYNQVVAANAGAPSSANFALRARLIEFDTEDSITTARGWVSAAVVAPSQGTLGAVIA